MTANLLAGAKVRLTALDKDDAGTIARWSEDTTFLRLHDTNTALPQSVEQVAEEIAKTATGSDEILFGIRTTADDELIGTLGFYEIEWANRCAWLGIGIGDPAHWGKGYGTEALHLAIAFAFGELNLRRLSLTVIAYNERAIALYERAGFVREGAFREFGERDGAHYDLVLYGLLRREWKPLCASKPPVA
jgi:RimJ/RimL family protein N-acetyltransferase